MVHNCTEFIYRLNILLKHNYSSILIIVIHFIYIYFLKCGCYVTCMKLEWISITLHVICSLLVFLCVCVCSFYEQNNSLIQKEIGHTFIFCVGHKAVLGLIALEMLLALLFYFLKC